MTHLKILNALQCDDLYSLVPQDFLDEFQLNRPEQYGMVCKDTTAQALRLESLGSTPFLQLKQPVKRWTENGATKVVTPDAALGYSNGQQIELLGAGEGTTLYSDLIPEDGSLKLHHVCVMQRGIDQIKARLNSAGYESPISLEVGIRQLYSIRVMYFDTREELGFWLEIAEYITLGMHMPMGEALISNLAKLQKRFG